MQREIEEKLLFLIQLWYDTFMLHEDEFGEVIAVYKELRAEGVVFPRREAAHQFLIDFAGRKSPIFEGIEGDRVYEEPAKTLNPSNLYAVKADDPCGGQTTQTRVVDTFPAAFTVDDAPAVERALFHFEELLAAAVEPAELGNAVFIELCAKLRSFAEDARRLLVEPMTSPRVLVVIKELYPRAKKAIREYEDRLEGVTLAPNSGTAPVHSVDLLEMDEAPAAADGTAEVDLLALDLCSLSLPSAAPSAIAQQKHLEDFFGSIQSR